MDRPARRTGPATGFPANCVLESGKLRMPTAFGANRRADVERTWNTRDVLRGDVTRDK
uniref:Uncharacterized protein n=1 Tax=Hyaloperonospora arabidopsidis (strain Emoy2) TaxID=559515 RepID=M4C0F2_HYAAE